ncbi:hypothetical protein AB4205_07855 [Vibrio sp. 10N.286.49.F3]|uniref:hypothetical protein n=1 Tax=unclassified Vibrio TaxID=2614977 RepID=UPI00354EEA32
MKKKIGLLKTTFFILVIAVVVNFGGKAEPQRNTSEKNILDMEVVDERLNNKLDAYDIPPNPNKDSNHGFGPSCQYSCHDPM